MKDLKNFIQSNSVIFITVYIVVSIFVIGLLSYKLIFYQCETIPAEILIQKKHREKIKQINSAEDRASIDSLFIELYGFSPK